MTTLDPGREVEMIRKHYGEFGGLYDPAQAVAHVRILLAEVDRLNSWAGLMSVLDKHYPPDVIGGNSRDPGVRHVVLVRKLDQLGIELEAAREENRQLHARVDELDGVEQELAEARRITESAERHAYSADKWRADTEADLARVNLELARLRALKHTTNLEMFDEIAALKAENRRLLRVVEKAKAWRARILSDGEYATEDADDLAAAVDALGTDAADGAGTGEQRADVVMTGVKALLEHAGALERREPPYRQIPASTGPEQYIGSNKDRQSIGNPGHCERCVSVGHEAAHPQLGCGDVGCYADHESAASPAGSSTADEEDGRG